MERLGRAPPRDATVIRSIDYQLAPVAGGNSNGLDTPGQLRVFVAVQAPVEAADGEQRLARQQQIGTRGGGIPQVWQSD